MVRNSTSGARVEGNMNNASRVHYIFEATMDGRLTEQGRLERINRHVGVRNDGTGCLPLPFEVTMLFLTMHTTNVMISAFKNVDVTLRLATIK